MAQQNIDIGTFPNDPSADSIRAAFQKIQNNFTELYSSTQSSAVLSVRAGSGLTSPSTTGNILLSANISNVTIQTGDSLFVGVGAVPTVDSAGAHKATITTSSTPFKIDLAPTIVTSNGRFSNTVTTGNLSVTNSINSNLIPSLDSVYNLGSPTKRWKTLYISAQTIDLGGALIGSDGTSVSVSNLSVASSIVTSTVTSSSVTSPTINVGSAQITGSAQGGVLSVPNISVSGEMITQNIVVNNNMNVQNITTINMITQTATMGGTTIDHTGTITVGAAQTPITGASSVYGNIVITGASSTGGFSTLTFNTQSSAPFTKGQSIVVSGVTPAGFNGIKTVTDCTTTSVSFDGTTAGPMTVAGKLVTGTITLTFGNQGYIPFVVGQTITIISMKPDSWNGVQTVTDCTQTTVSYIFTGTAPGPMTFAGVITAGGTIIASTGAVQIGSTSIASDGALSVGNTTITTDGAITTAPGATTPDFHAPGNDTELLFNSNGNVSNISAVTYNAGTNLLSIAGNIQSGNLVSTGILSSTINTLGQANVASLVSRGTASITGTATVGALVTSGSLSAGAATVSSLTTPGSATITGGVVAGSLRTTGTLAAGAATVSSLTTSGSLSAGAATVGSLTTTGSVSAATATVGSLTSQGDATITGTATVGSLSITSGVLTAGATTVTSLTSQGDASVTGNAIVGNLSTAGTLSAGATTLGSIYTPGVSSVLGNHYVSASTFTGGNHTIGSNIAITNIQPSTPQAGSLRVTFADQGFTPFIRNQSVTIIGVTTTTAYNTTYTVSAGNSTTATLTSSQTGAVGLSSARILGGGSLTMSGTLTPGNIVTPGNANIFGTANISNLVTTGNSNTVGVHYIGVGGATVGSNVLVANGDARTVGTHYISTGNITSAIVGSGIVGGGSSYGSAKLTVNGDTYTSGTHTISTGYTSTYHVIGSGDKIGSNLLTVNGSSYTSGTHYVGGSSNVSQNHIVGGYTVIGGGSQQSGANLTVTGDAYITGQHVMGTGVSTSTHYVGSGSLAQNYAFGVNGNSYTNNTHSMKDGISSNTHYVGTGTLVPGPSSNVFGVNGNSYTTGTHFMGNASVSKIEINTSIVGGGSARTNNVFTANGNVYTSGNHYVNTNSIVIGNHVVGAATGQSGYIFTANGNSYTAINHYVAGDSVTVGNHTVRDGFSTNSHFIGTGSLIGSNIFGVSGNSYITGTHYAEKGLSNTSHYVGAGTLVTGSLSNIFGVNGSSYVNGTHTMKDSVTNGNHYVGGTSGVTVGSNVLVANGSAYTVNTHTMKDGITTGTHVIGGTATQQNYTLTVTGNGYNSGNHYIGGYSVVGGGARQDINTTLSITGNSYTSTNHTIGANNYVSSHLTAGTTSPRLVDGSTTDYYKLTITGNGYVSQSHYVGGYSVIGGGSQKGSNILSVNGSSYTSGTHTMENGVSNTSHYIGVSGATVPTGLNPLLTTNGNVFSNGTHSMKDGVSTNSHYVGALGVTTPTGLNPILTSNGNAYINGIHHVNSNSIVTGTHTIGGTTAQTGNTLTVTGNSYVSSNHYVAGSASVGGGIQTNNAFSVTGNIYVSSNHTVAGSATTGGTHTINLTNPYAYTVTKDTSIWPSSGTYTVGTKDGVSGAFVTFLFSNQTTSYSIGSIQNPFTVGQRIIVGGGFQPSATVGTFIVTSAPTPTTNTSVTIFVPGSSITGSGSVTCPGGTTSGTGDLQHYSSLSVQGIITVQGNANIGNITAVSSITGGVVTLLGNASQQQLISAGIIRMGGNHVITGTHTVGVAGLLITSVSNFVNGGVTLNFATQAVAPFVPGQIINLLNAGVSAWSFSNTNLNINIDYIVASCTTTSVIIGTTAAGGTQITNINNIASATPGTGVVSLSPSNPSMSVAGGAYYTGNISLGTGVTIYKDGNVSAPSGTFTANLFTGNVAGNVAGGFGYKYGNLDPTTLPNTTVKTATSAAGGAFTYSTATGFNFTPSLTYKVGTPNSPVKNGSGAVSLTGDTITYTPPDLSGFLTGVSFATNGLPADPVTGKPTGAAGTVIACTGLNVDASGYLYNTGVTKITGTADQIIRNTAAGDVTLSLPQSIATTSTVQFGSIGIGKAAGSAGQILSSGMIYTTSEIRAGDNITAYYSSDRKFKENIRPISNALSIVIAIGGKLFDWTDEYLESKGGQDGYFHQKSDFGVIAQDLINAGFEVAVRTKPDGSLAVDYEKLAALSFQAIVEQEEKHKQDIKSLQDQIDTITNLLKDKK